MAIQFKQSQFDALNDYSDSAIESRLVGLFAEVLPSESKYPQGTELEELIRNCRLRGAALKITEDVDVAVFALWVVASSSFDVTQQKQFQAWVTKYLQRESSSGAVNMAFAERILRENAAEHPLARQLCAWGDAVRTAMAP